MINKIRTLRKKASKFSGSYEESYNFLIEGLDKIIIENEKEIEKQLKNGGKINEKSNL